MSAQDKSIMHIQCIVLKFKQTNGLSSWMECIKICFICFI